MVDPLVREAKQLYGRPREEFTAARNLRAKELRKKDPGLATEVARLAKPTVAAAAVNELVREDPSEVRALLQSARRLRQAQEQAVAGRAGPDVNAAIAEHRAALDRVVRDLRGRGVAGATLEKAMQTLRAASLDPELQPLLERGTLAQDLRASGFGLDPSLVPAAPRKRREAPAKPRPDADDARRRREAEAALAAAERKAEAARRELARAEADVERARRTVDELG